MTDRKTALAFALAWEESPSLGGVAMAAGLAKKQCTKKANHLRGAHGVPLKTFKRSPTGLAHEPDTPLQDRLAAIKEACRGIRGRGRPRKNRDTIGGEQ